MGQTHERLAVVFLCFVTETMTGGFINKYIDFQQFNKKICFKNEAWDTKACWFEKYVIEVRYRINSFLGELLYEVVESWIVCKCITYICICKIHKILHLKIIRVSIFLLFFLQLFWKQGGIFSQHRFLDKKNLLFF